MKCKLSDICDYAKGKVLVASLTKNNYISTENMLPNRCGIVTATSLPTVEYTHSYCCNDVLVSNIRPYFKKIWYAESDGGCSNDVLVFRAKEGVSSKYLYYVLADDAFFNYSNVTAKGTKMPRGDKSAIMDYVIEKHSLSEQQKIAELLSAFDKKIVNNNAIIDNLQQQIQALYDSWFKRYEPFSTNGFVQTELGEIPSGWSVCDIYSIASVIYGAPFASPLFNTEKKGMPIVRIRDLKEQCLDTYTTEDHPKGYLLQLGDIVVGMDGEFRPYIWGNDAAWLNQRVCVFNNRRPNGKAFLYCTLKPLLWFIEETEAATTVIHIGKKDFDGFRLALPPQKVLDSFDSLTDDMYWQIVHNQLQNRRLASLRDTLLPKLMSGEIDVSDVEI